MKQIFPILLPFLASCTPRIQYCCVKFECTNDFLDWHTAQGFSTYDKCMESLPKFEEREKTKLWRCLP